MTTEQREEDPNTQLEKSLALFQAYLDNTPREEIDKIIKEIEGIGSKGVTVEEYFDGVARDFYAVTNDNKELRTKLQRLEEIIKAADEVIVFYDKISRDLLPQEEKALEKYRELKSKLPSGI